MFQRLLCTLAICALAASAALASPAAGGNHRPALPPQPKVHPAGIPAGALLLSPCIQTMGEHWAALKDLPHGPIYGVYRGKPIFTEMMVSVKDLQNGYSIDDIRPLPGYRIDHVDFEYEPHGHEGYPVPHYDLHAYYVSAAAQANICPHGVPDPAMKPHGKM